MTTNIAFRDNVDQKPDFPGSVPSGATWPATRHGALTREAAEKLLGPGVLGAALDEGTVVQPWFGVVVPAARSRDPLTRAAAALLRAGDCALLSGRTAVELHGCSAATDRNLHVTVPYDQDRRSVPGLTMHQAWVREVDVVELDGLRVQALDLALVELLCAGPHRVALASLEEAFEQLGESAELFRSQIRERLARRRDRRGTRQAARILELAWAGPVDAAEQDRRDGA